MALRPAWAPWTKLALLRLSSREFSKPPYFKTEIRQVDMEAYEFVALWL